MMKGHLFAGNIEGCFRILNRIEEQPDIAPTQATEQVFDRMVKSDCPMNTVLYTTLIKGFVKAGNLEKAVTVFEQMREQNVERDCVTYSILAKALCDNGDVDR